MLGSIRTFCTHRVYPMFGIILRVGYGLSVCDPALRECIAMLSKIPSTPRLKWCLAPIYDRSISLSCLTFHTSSKHLASWQEQSKRHHDPLCVLAGKSYFAILDISRLVSLTAQFFDHTTSTSRHFFLKTSRTT
ncbi:hypothetical protein BJV78DRAFT_1217166 [Lactifluus subvellereus]|nr:hypothetical protein BJV78DRAFT_1217166 [Lactifluus subvellereus]